MACFPGARRARLFLNEFWAMGQFTITPNLELVISFYDVCINSCLLTPGTVRCEL